MQIHEFKYKRITYFQKSFLICESVAKKPKQRLEELNQKIFQSKLVKTILNNVLLHLFQLIDAAL